MEQAKGLHGDGAVALRSAYRCALRTVTAFTLTWQPSKSGGRRLEVR